MGSFLVAHRFDKPLGQLRKPVVGFAGRTSQGYPLSQEQAFMLSTKALQEFKEVWKKKYGEEISDDFALEQAVNLLTLFATVYKPIKKEWSQEKDERQ